MSIHSEAPEIDAILTRTLDNLSKAASSQTGLEGATLRQKIGIVRANFVALLAAGEFGSALLACFTAAREANVTLHSLAMVRQGLFAETPVGTIAKAIVQSAIVFCLAQESRMIAAIEFTSRDDVDVMMTKMRLAFDTAREIAADAIDSDCYQKLTYLAGALTNHLATEARPLPKMVSFKVAKSLPALALSMRLYYKTDRWEELMLENKTVNPVFMQREVRGLSA
jgi:hypothetical protein